MLQEPCDKLTLSLANILAGKHEDSINESLKLICEGLSFDCGLIYEADNFNGFNLAERFLLRETPLCKRLAGKEITQEYRARLTEETVSYIRRDSRNTSYETGMLDAFSADVLAVSPVVDEHLWIYGLVVFFRAAPQEEPKEYEKKAMFVLLSMLTRYVTIRMYQNKLSRAKTSLENILDNTGIDIYVNDFYNHDILYVNESMAAPYGGKEQFSGKKCWQVLFPGQGGPCEFCPEKKLLDENGEPSKVYVWDYQRPFDGSWFRVFSAAFKWMDGRLAHVVSSADITDNKEKEALIEYMANYDPLTKLPNRRMLVNECERRINKATETEQGYVLFFDIDGFKLINDNFGHDAGDEFLVQLSEFFSSIPLLQGSIYRNGGDEFVAVFGGEAVTKKNIESLTNFIHMRFTKPWVLKRGTVYCNTSIGVACYPEDGRDAEELLRIADMAMYQVKKSGGGGMCFGYQLK